MESVEIEVQVAKVDTKVETEVSKTKKERSKSDSGSDRERADKISVQLTKKNVQAYDSRNSAMKNSGYRRSVDNKSYSNHSGSDYKNQYYNVPKFGEQRTSVQVQSQNQESIIDEMRRSTEQKIANDKYFTLGTQEISTIKHVSDSGNDFKYDLYKDFKFDAPKYQVTKDEEINVTVSKVVDSHIDIEAKEHFENLKRQNELMYEKIKMTKPYESTVMQTTKYHHHDGGSFNKELSSSFHKEESSSLHKEFNHTSIHQGGYSYQKYLEEQEKRHTEQIEKIYKQNAEYNSKLSLQISQLQAENSNLERKYMREIQEY